MLDKKITRRNFFTEFKKVFKNKQVIIAIAATLILLIIFRLGASFNLPGVKRGENQDTIVTSGSLIDMMALISGAGGAGSQISLFSVGISPYITAQIIMQLLSSDLVKPLSRLLKSGEKGRRRIEVYTRLLTIPFAIAQGYALISMSISQNFIIIDGKTVLSEVSWETILKLLVALTAGSLLSIFIGDIITKKGVGNGTTLLILSGILSQFYVNFGLVYNYIINPSANAQGTELIIKYVFFFSYVLMFFLLLLSVVFIYGSTRKIPIQQIGQSLTKGTDELAFLPIKVNTVGVIPVIFASSIMTIPPTIGQFISSNGSIIINEYFSLTSPLGLIIYVILIILFNFFYSYIQINPQQIAENFKKSGKYIPGVKSGIETEKYISRVLIRINCIGAPFLALVSAIPYIIAMTTGIPTGLAIGGTGIIIIVSASLEFWQAICSMQTNYSYSKTRKNIQNTYLSNDSIKVDSEYLW